MSDLEILDAIQKYKLACGWNNGASEPRWEVTPSDSWKPAFSADIRDAVRVWVREYSKCPPLREMNLHRD